MMKCSTFKAKLYDYMEENVLYDMKEAMDNHLKECESCRKLYEEEKNLDDALREAFKIEDVEFTSSRAAIMKSIDKEKYTGGPINKANYHVRRFKTKYFATAAVFLFAVFMAPYIARFGGGAKKSADLASQRAGGMLNKAEKESTEDMNFAASTADNGTAAKSDEPVAKGTESLQGADMKLKEAYIPVFQKRDRTQQVKTDMARPWTVSPNGKMEATVDGIGVEGQEQGIGSIVVNYIDTNRIVEFYLIDNQKQYSPKHVEWLDAENLLVVIGYGQGRVDLGGNLYLFNTNSLRSAVVYETTSNQEQILTTKRSSKEKLQIKKLIYEDWTLNKSHFENTEITFREVTGNVEISEVDTVYTFTRSISNKKYDEAKGNIIPSSLRVINERLGDLTNIQSMQIKRLIDITEPYTAGEQANSYFAYKVYYALVDYKVENSQKTPLQSGSYYQKIIVVKEKKEAEWKIFDIITVPQN